MVLFLYANLLDCHAHIVGIKGITKGIGGEYSEVFIGGKNEENSRNSIFHISDTNSGDRDNISGSGDGVSYHKMRKQKLNKWINILAYGCVCCYFVFWVLPVVVVGVIPNQEGVNPEQVGYGSSMETRHMWEALPHWFGVRQDIPDKEQYIIELPPPPNNGVLDLMWHWALTEVQQKSGDIIGWTSLVLIATKVIYDAALEGHSIARGEAVA